jgi:hypothetical protein
MTDLTPAPTFLVPSGEQGPGGAPRDSTAAPPGQRPEIFLAIPCLDRRIDIKTISGLIQVLSAMGGKVQPYFLAGASNIRGCRNQIAHYFMRHTPCTQSVWVDSDIGFNLKDFLYLMEGPEDVVIGPYAKKELGLPPVDLGMGFVRISRAVFQSLADWTIEEGPEKGAECLGRYFNKGEVLVDYFFDGAAPDMRWFGEDTGFFHWVAMRGHALRQEVRCRLVHVGPFEWGYPDPTPGLMPLEGAQ